MHIYAAQSRQSNSAWASTVCVAFTRSRLATFAISPIRRFTALPPPGPRFLLSHEELATLWHPPTAGVTAEKMRVADYTELEAPAFLPSGAAAGEIVVGQVQHRSDRRIFGQARDDRRRHVHIVGRTRVGRTTLLLNQIHADIASGQGVGLIDPHGDLADTVLRLIPRHRTNDVILFDAADREFAIAFNPLPHDRGIWHRP